MPATSRKNFGLSIALQKLPIVPARKPPVKLADSQTPIKGEGQRAAPGGEMSRAGATLVTKDSPTGER